MFTTWKVSKHSKCDIHDVHDIESDENSYIELSRSRVRVRLAQTTQVEVHADKFRANPGFWACGVALGLGLREGWVRRPQKPGWIPNFKRTGLGRASVVRLGWGRWWQRGGGGSGQDRIRGGCSWLLSKNYFEMLRRTSSLALSLKIDLTYKKTKRTMQKHPHPHRMTYCAHTKMWSAVSSCSTWYSKNKMAVEKGTANTAHKAGPLKQQNKAHKQGRHRSKSGVDKQNRGVWGVCT